MKKISLILICLLPLLLFSQSDEFSLKKSTLKVHPLLHSTMALEWNGQKIFVDPYGGVEHFAAFGNPDLVLITDIHGDHMNTSTLEKLDLSKAELIAPQAVIDKLGDITFKKVTPLANGEEVNTQGLKVMGIPMYNLPETSDSRHPKGRGNGYVISIESKRIYISGDTEDISEMRELKDIDIAFVCMNLPYTMAVDQAADAVLDFNPKIIYPFHYRGGGGKFGDVEKFKSLVNKGNDKIEVRLRNWYPSN